MTEVSVQTRPAVEFFFDFGSPTTYLAYKVLPRIASRQGAEVVWRPILLGAVFKLSNNTPPGMNPLKSRWMMQDLTRWAHHWGVPFAPAPIPLSTLQLARGATALLGTPDFVPYCDAVFEGMWCYGLDFGNPEVLQGVVRRIGLDPASFDASIASSLTKKALTDATEELVQRGGFGAPTMFVGDEMHFGQDRLGFVEAALRAQKERT